MSAAAIGRNRLFVAVALDAAAIVLFVILGRGAHDEGSLIGGTLTIAAPFLLGYAIAALVVRLDRAPWDLRRGLALWAVAVVLGLGLRGTVFQRGLAPAFVVVATVTLGVLLLGWRAAARGVRKPGRRAST